MEYYYDRYYGNIVGLTASTFKVVVWLDLSCFVWSFAFFYADNLLFGSLCLETTGIHNLAF